MKLLLLLAILVQRGTGQDSTRPRLLDPIVVTAERVGTGLRSSATAITRLSSRDLLRMPRATLADLLRMAPGFALVDFDGLGFDPQLMVRGFYGGGEAEYVVVQIDGKPVNQVMSGLVAWDALPPLASVEAIEIVRGGASSLYGDAAIGGIVNVISRSGVGMTPGARLRWNASAGSHGTVRAAADLGAPPDTRRVTLSGAVDRTDGFRVHAGRLTARAAASIPLLERPGRHLALSLRSHWRDLDEPGPLLESLLVGDRRSSDPLFRFDHTTDRSMGAGVDGRRRFGSLTELVGGGSIEVRTVEAVRTFALAPGFGDTKERRAGTTRASVNLQAESSDVPLPGAGRVVAGVEATRGSLDSRYYRVTGGSRADYVAAAGARGDLDTSAESTRSAAAAYVQYIVRATGALRLSLGGRFDLLHDSFHPSVPDGQSRHHSTHTAVSPKLGLNFRYWNGSGGVGHAYLAVSRSFKAPTLDQKYDLRNIPIPFPPFELRTSNPELVPQHGTGLESGLYHNASASSAVRVAGSLSMYQMEMTDELDFDVESFRYVNLGRSRHRGVEVGVRLERAGASGFAGYALQAATARRGANAGKRLKAIPRHSLNAGLSLQPLRKTETLETSLAVSHLRGMYLDDANSRTLPDFTRLDAQVALRMAGLSIHLDVRNLLNAQFSSTGFLDPAGTGEAYLYPAAGRVVEVGVRRGW